MGIRVIVYNARGIKEVKLEEIEAYPDYVKWISLLSPTPEEIGSVAQCYDLHPLVVDDMAYGQKLPKVDEYSKYTFMIINVPEYEEEVKIHKLYLILGKDFLISSTDYWEVVRSADEVLYKKARSILDQGPDFLAYVILDHAVDRFYPVLDDIEDQVSDIEDEVIERPDKNVILKMSASRRGLLDVRKSAWLIRDVISALERGSSPFIKRDTAIYMRDVYDHVAQIMDLVETYRDILASSRDTYMSSVSNLLNEVMKQLTIIATIMLPLTFIAGVYGMNFKFMPILEWKYGYYAVLAFMIILTAAMLVYFKKKRWI